MLPLVFSIILNLLLQPALRILERLHVPRMLARSRLSPRSPSCSSRARTCRSTISRSSSPTRRPIRPRCSTARPEQALRTHLGCVLLNYLIGVDITHVPYRGTGPAMQDLQGGRIDYLCEIVSTAKPQIDGGTVKGIAMMTKERSKVLPNVPTGIEQGVPNLEAYTWNAIFLPKGAPAEMVNKLNRATVEAMQSANVRERLEGLGAVIVPPVHATPEYLAHFVRSEIEKWTGPIKASGVTVE